MGREAERKNDKILNNLAIKLYNLLVEVYLKCKVS